MWIFLVIKIPRPIAAGGIRRTTSQSSEKAWSSAGYSGAPCSGANAVGGGIPEHPTEMIHP